MNDMAETPRDLEQQITALEQERMMNITGGQRLASWGQRAVALILDTIVLGVTVVIAVGVALTVSFAFAVLMSLAISLGYYMVTMSRKGVNNGQTLGKQIVGIKVIREDEADVDAGYAFLRETIVKGFLFGTVAGVLLGIPTLINYLRPLWNDHNRAWHDSMVKSYVVRVD